MYDIIILGAGVAGSGLAYNLKKIGYGKKILVIDAKGPGTNKVHSTRTVLKKLVDRYELPHFHKYRGLINTAYGEPLVLDYEVYSVDYEKICSYLLGRSGAQLHVETALDVDENRLVTDKGTYRFSLLVDCSGRQSFVRRKFRLPTSRMFWLVKAMVLENNERISADYMYWLTDQKGYYEEFCPYPDHIAVADYQFTNKLDFSLIKAPDKLFRNEKLKNIKVISKSAGYIPSTPHFPLVYRKRFAFLGDSFGNLPTSTAYGSEAILSTSEILADCIARGKLGEYERRWKKKYLDSYIKWLTIKYDLYGNSPLLARVKNYPAGYSAFKVLNKYPDQMIKFLEDPTYMFECLDEVTRANPSPLKQKLFRAYYYAFLHARAYLEGLRKF